MRRARLSTKVKGASSEPEGEEWSETKPEALGLRKACASKKTNALSQGNHSLLVDCKNGLALRATEAARLCRAQFFCADGAGEYFGEKARDHWRSNFEERYRLVEGIFDVEELREAEQIGRAHV